MTIDCVAIGKVKEFVVHNLAQIGVELPSWLQTQQVTFTTSGDEQNEVVDLCEGSINVVIVYGIN
jgi:hypothetical protein